MTYLVARIPVRRIGPGPIAPDLADRPPDSVGAESLEKLGIAPIESLTFHSLRRTFASLRLASGDDPRYVSSQLGHTDVRFSLAVYAQATGRRERMAKPQRDAYDRALDWAQLGTNEVLDIEALRTKATKSPA